VSGWTDWQACPQSAPRTVMRIASRRAIVQLELNHTVAVNWALLNVQTSELREE